MAQNSPGEEAAPPGGGCGSIREHENSRAKLVLGEARRMGPRTLLPDPKRL